MRATRVERDCETSMQALQLKCMKNGIPSIERP